jgi:hypothetical protein
MAFSLEAVRAAKSLLAECGIEEATALLRELSTERARSRSTSRETSPAAAAPAAGSDDAPSARARRPWTEEQRKAAAERMKKRWESGAMIGKAGRKKSGKGKKDHAAP